MNPKQVAGVWAANQVTSGMKVGLGTGSTAYFAIQRLGERLAEGLRITATATSVETENLAKEWNIPLLSLADIGQLDLTIDGADEISPELHLVKGGGGALFREKMVHLRSNKVIIIADERKAVDTLGAFPLPIEVVPFGHEITKERLSELDLHPVLREDSAGDPYLTDNHNLIYDCHVGVINDPISLDPKIKCITGVVETGLFLGIASMAVIGSEEGEVRFLSRS